MCSRRMPKLLPLIVLAACIPADRALVIKGKILAQDAAPTDCQLNVFDARTGAVLAAEADLQGSRVESNHPQEFVRSIWEELPTSGSYYLTVECKGYSYGFRSMEFDFAYDSFVDLGEVVVHR